MRIEITLTGTTPLLMHNVQLADPDNAWTKAIAAINAKASDMTEDDRREKARLQWFGGLYVGRNGHANRPVIPTANLRRCFRDAGVMTREGKSILRALVPLDLETPLIYDGPTDLEQLQQLPQFAYTTMVGINRGKVQNTRPQFSRWQLRAQFELITEVLDYAKFVVVVQRAGVSEGLGDNRVNGFGRFTAEVKQA